jgi:uncharacterized membrane-anchored protein
MEYMREALAKVPEISIFFWIIKILTTAMGESTSDYLVAAINPIIAVLLGLIALIVVLTLQFRAKCYIPWLYWLTVVMVAIFGTMAADVLHVGLGIPYLDTTSFFLIALAAIFALWYRVEGTLSIHSITSTQREIFYWATVITTFALGTAAGDMAAVTLGLGYLDAGVIFGGLIALITLGHYTLKWSLTAEHRRQSVNAVLAFWLAYIFTRPLGASFADWAGKAPSFGGLGWGDGTVSIILGVLIVAFIGYLTVTKSTD